MTESKGQEGGVTRLSFLKSSAGVAAGAAMIAVPTAVAQAAEEKTGVPVAPSSPNPREPVVAYVRDAAARRGDRDDRNERDDLPRPRARQAAAGRSARRRGSERRRALMSSHREAPEISKDPVADNADVYAFVSPDQPDTRHDDHATSCRSQDPPGGPNFFEFGDDVLYSIYIDNDGDGRARDRLRVQVQDRAARTRTRSSTTPARSPRSTARTGTSASSTR